MGRAKRNPSKPRLTTSVMGFASALPILRYLAVASFCQSYPLQTIPVATSLYEYKADEKRALKAGGSVADVASALIYEHTI